MQPGLRRQSKGVAGAVDGGPRVTASSPESRGRKSKIWGKNECGRGGSNPARCVRERGCLRGWTSAEASTRVEALKRRMIHITLPVGSDRRVFTATDFYRAQFLGTQPLV